ncbi:MAG: DedA family protein [Candidatus Competibacterales bacterium]
MEHFIAEYGYWAIFLGAMVEGEVTLIIGGFLAHREYLFLVGVIAAAFLGGMVNDHLFFFLGRYKGMAWLAKRPRWRAYSETMIRQLHAHQTWIILSFRFFYGLRALTPFLIGASGIHPLRFFVLNAIGALVWAVLLGCLGYFLGQTLTRLIDDLHRFELAIILLLALTGLVVWYLGRRGRAS